MVARKAPGQDNLNAEIFKTNAEIAAKLLLPLFKEIQENETVFIEWTMGIIIKIPIKKEILQNNIWN